MGEIAEFLGTIFGPTLPDGLYTVLTAREGGMTSRSFRDHGEAEKWASGKTDVYTHVTLASRAIKGSTRIKNTTAAAMAGVWADIDVNGGPEGVTGKAPDMDEAEALARSVLEPSIMLHSPFGVHAWWLFDDGLWRLETQPDRDAAAKLAKGWQARLQEQVPWRIDATGDLSRLLRLPDTFNGKAKPPAPTDWLDSDDRPSRYPRQRIDDEAIEVIASAVTLDNLDKNLRLDPAAKPGAKWAAATENDPNLLTKLLGQHPEDKGKSRSQVDMSFCHKIVHYGLSNQEITDLLVWARIAKGEKLKEPGYYALSIKKARLRQQVEERTERRAEAQVEAAEELAEMNAAMTNGHVEPNPAKALGLFNTLIGAPREAKELVQYGTATGRKQHTYKLVLVDGTELALGSAYELLDIRSFTARYTAGAGFIPDLSGEGIKQRWRDALSVLIRHRRIVETEDEGERMRSWLADYGRRAKTAKTDTVPKGKPWRDDEKGMLHVHAPHFLTHLRTQVKEQIDEADLSRLFEAVGATRHNLSYGDPSTPSGRNSKSYYRVPLDDLAGADDD